MSDTRIQSSDVFVREQFVPPSDPPVKVGGALAWVRERLFGNVWQGLLTLFGLYLVYSLVWPIIQFGLIDAVWDGTNDTCRQGHGACWPMIQAKYEQYIYGRYPLEERWRVDIVFYSGLALLVPLLIPAVPLKTLNAVALLVLYPIAALILLTGGAFEIGGIFGNLLGLADPIAAFAVDWGIFIAVLSALVIAIGMGLGVNLIATAIAIAIGLILIGAVVALCGYDFGLSSVETPLWGGLLVTLVVAVVGIVASLPLGVLLALGRRSDMPIVKTVCITFIEFWRGVPLITVLFMSSVMFPLFLPDGVTFDKLLRALVGVALFSSAYMAEVVRGGLQAIPKGQFEGADALGLNYSQTMGLIVLPQALKHVIPGIVNSFIALFKDTTLVLIIGLFDLLGIIQLSFTDPNWASPVQSHTGYLFAALIFFIFCFGMSQYSYFMERKLHTGHKR